MSFKNDNKPFDHYDLEIVAVRFVHTIYWFNRLNIKPLYLTSLTTCKDLRIAFEIDTEGTMLLLQRLPNVGIKTAWKIYNYVNEK